MKDLTPIQKYLLGIIQQYNDEGKPAPTYRELCRQFGWTSTATVRDHLKALERKGYLHLSGGRARSLEIVRSPGKLLLEFSLSSPISAHPPDDAGGFHIVKNNRKCYAVRVSDSYVEEFGIGQGDLAVINTERDFREGDIILIEFDTDQVFRRIQMQMGRAALYDFLTRKTESFLASQEHVIGVVVGFIRYLNIDFFNNK
ncbi:MAG: S24 family peptidase [bacterium]